MTDNNFIDDLSDQENDYLLEFHNNLLEIHELNGKQNNLSTNCENDNDSQFNEINQNDINLNKDILYRENYPKEPKSINPLIHTKFKKDNILRRIKVHFFKFLILLCNDFIKKIYKKQKFKFKKIENNKNISDVSIRFNLALREKSLFYILCEIGNKKKSLESTKNYKLIYKLIEDNEVFRDFFNLKIEYLYNLFILKEKTKEDLVKLYGLRKALTMEDYIKQQLENNIDNNEYVENFRFFALNFFKIFNVKYARIRKKTKDN